MGKYRNVGFYLAYGFWGLFFLYGRTAGHVSKAVYCGVTIFFLIIAMLITRVLLQERLNKILKKNAPELLNKANDMLMMNTGLDAERRKLRERVWAVSGAELVKQDSTILGVLSVIVFFSMIIF